MSIRAGLLTEKINIKRATITVNDFGEETEVWSTVYSTRARVIQQSSNKVDENSEILVAYTKEFQVRYYVPIMEFDIIEWNNKQYRIISLNQDRVNQYTTIIGELINE